MNGQEIAQTLYSTRPAGIYQIRDRMDHKLAQFSSPDKVREYLQERNPKHLQVYMLKDYPGELLEVVSGEHYLDRYGD